MALIFPKAITVGVNLVVFCSPRWAVGNVFFPDWAMEWQQLWSETQRTLLAMEETVYLCQTQYEKNNDEHKQVCLCVERVHNCYTPLSVSGVCECSDFTTGMTCEHCLDGYYGNALIGTLGDCQPCPCPDRTSCAQIAETGQVVCTNCPTGQTGEMDHQQCKIIFMAPCSK